MKNRKILFFPFQDNAFVRGRVWSKAAIIRVGLFRVHVGLLDSQDNIVSRRIYRYVRKGRKTVKELKGIPLHLFEMKDRAFLVRNWPWENKDND